MNRFHCGIFEERFFLPVHNLLVRIAEIPFPVKENQHALHRLGPRVPNNCEAEFDASSLVAVPLAGVKYTFSERLSGC
jgi:hypothetical protein